MNAAFLLLFASSVRSASSLTPGIPMIYATEHAMDDCAPDMFLKELWVPQDVCFQMSGRFAKYSCDGGEIVVSTYAEDTCQNQTFRTNVTSDGGCVVSGDGKSHRMACGLTRHIFSYKMYEDSNCENATTGLYFYSYGNCMHDRQAESVAQAVHCNSDQEVEIAYFQWFDTTCTGSYERFVAFNNISSCVKDPLGHAWYKPEPTNPWTTWDDMCPMVLTYTATTSTKTSSATTSSRTTTTTITTTHTVTSTSATMSSTTFSTTSTTSTTATESKAPVLLETTEASSSWLGILVPILVAACCCTVCIVVVLRRSRSRAEQAGPGIIPSNVRLNAGAAVV